MAAKKEQVLMVTSSRTRDANNPSRSIISRLPPCVGRMQMQVRSSSRPSPGAA
ncbi:hypothetical protein HDU84_003617, partial [Entophlyctis sp. JEL0112]